MKYISLVAHLQETGGEKHPAHVSFELALRGLEDFLTAHDPDEVRRRFFLILFYVCQKVFLME